MKCMPWPINKDFRLVASLRRQVHLFNLGGSRRSPPGHNVPHEEKQSASCPNRKTRDTRSPLAEPYRWKLENPADPARGRRTLPTRGAGGTSSHSIRAGGRREPGG